MADRSGYYLYAVTWAGARIDPREADGVIPSPGSGPARVEVVECGELAAIASPIGRRTVRPERRNLAAHQAVLSMVRRVREPHLPMGFGVVAPSRAALLDLLGSNAEDVASELVRLGETVEMGFKMSWNVPSVPEFLLREDAELAALRDDLLRRPSGPSHLDRIEMGRRFEALLGRSRERHRARVHRILINGALDIASDPPTEDRMILRLSCLIHRDQEAEFDAAVGEVAACYDENYAIDYGGPWAPFHFARLSLAPSPAVSRSSGA